MLLVIEQIMDLYIVVPYAYGKQCDQEYIFDNAEIVKAFCKYYNENPIAATFAYNLALEQST